MDKKFYRTTIIGGVILFVIGIILILYATDIGRLLASKALYSNGGSMGAEEYMFIMQSKTLSFQFVGTVCSIVGGIGVFLFEYKSNC